MYSATIIAPSPPMFSWARWAAIRSRSTKPNVRHSHSVAARTSGYGSTGITLADGTERLRGKGSRGVVAIHGTVSLARRTAAVASGDVSALQGFIVSAWDERGARHRMFATGR